ncbi:MAG: hypothetical protein Q9166_002488 [cf. Caloplaca sp. 2 TL-2023]
MRRQRAHMVYQALPIKIFQAWEKEISELWESRRYGCNSVVGRSFLPDSSPVPEGLVASLLRRFSSSEGYQLYDDVIPFFDHLHNWRKTASASRLGPSRVQVGIISNSDDRVPSILASLGIRVAGRRYGSSIIESTKHFDIDWVVMSYDVSNEKPDRGIFDAAKALSASFMGQESAYLHVGDSIDEDYHGALKAGLQSVLLDRDGTHESNVPKAARVTDLSSLVQKLKGET